MHSVFAAVMVFVGMAIFLGGVIPETQSGTLLRSALLTARRQRASFGNALRRLWDGRIDRALHLAAHPKGWSRARLNYLSLLAGSAGFVIGLLAVQSGAGLEGIWLGLVAGAGIAWATPVVAGRTLATRNKAAEAEEGIQLLQTIEVYLLNGYGPKEALEIAVDTLPYLGPRIQQALLVWGQGPYRALDSLANDVSDESTRLVITAVKQAIDVGAQDLPVFLQHEQEAVRRSREAQQKALAARKPIAMTMYLGLPILAYMSSFAMPLGIVVAAQITHISGI